MTETLTLMRLGVTGRLAKSLSSTNPIESMIEIVRHTQRNVKRWQDGDMRKRWTATGMLQAEQQFRRVVGYSDLLKARDRDRATTPHTRKPEPDTTLRAGDRHRDRRPARYRLTITNPSGIAVKVPRRSGRPRRCSAPGQQFVRPKDRPWWDTTMGQPTQLCSPVRCYQPESRRTLASRARCGPRSGAASRCTPTAARSGRAGGS